MDALLGILIFSVIGIVVGSSADGGQIDTLVAAQGLLLERLLGESSRYDRRVVPQVNDSQPIDLSLGIRLLGLIDLHEHDEALESFLYLDHMWHDFRLTWDPSRYQRLRVIHVPIQQLWRPDISVFNNAGIGLDWLDTLAMVFSTGQVYLAPKVKIRSQCALHMTRFPFDTQTCDIKLGSITYSSKTLNLTLLPVNMTFTDEYTTNPEWTITDVGAAVVTRSYPCCPDAYQHARFRFQLTRSRTYYVHVFVLPAVVLAMLVPIQFILPPDSRERLTLGSTLMLGVIVLIAMIQNFLPQAHPELPYLVQYYTLTMLWVAISLVCSATVMNTQCRGQRKKKVPAVIRQVFLKTLKTLVCLNEEAYYPLEEVETVSLRSLEKQLLNPPDPSRTEGGKLERDIEDILRQVNSLVIKNVLGDKCNNVQTEWYQVAIVFDRVMGIVFAMVFLIYSFALLG